jgi:threonylcarbamoyladenosine tRNA methylthiotransferase MtaB
MNGKTQNTNIIETFGCRLNTFESEVIRGHLPLDNEKQRIVFNTCAVTAEAERQARQAIRRARRNNPDAEIIVTGCAAQINPDEFESMPEVDRVIGNEEKLLPDSWIRDSEARVAVNDIMDVNEIAPQLVTGFEGRIRAFVQIQQGCDHRCTFCIIPFGRGNSRSVPIGGIVNQAQTLVDNGYQELVLTGVDITSYGSDLPGQPNLGSMIRRLLINVPGIKRLRLSSVDPVEIDSELLKLIENDPRLMPHLHLSIQAGDDMILKRMKRRHLRKDVIHIAKHLKNIRPDIVLGADLIAGFPTETDIMFKQSLSLISEIKLLHLHVFPYSAREGTPAAKMPQVPTAIRKERASILRDAGKKELMQYIESRVGKTERVLIEKESLGHTEHFIPMVINDPTTPGEVVKAIVQTVSTNRLCGVVKREGPH